jgi:hypothetical protein
MSLVAILLSMIGHTMSFIVLQGYNVDFKLFSIVSPNLQILNSTEGVMGSNA